MEHVHKGGCHCGAIGLELRTSRPPQAQVIGACQCSFCRKHNARTFSDPGAQATLSVREPQQLGRYAFGLATAEAVICRRCGVYVAMVLVEGDRAWSTISIDALDDRALFDRPAEPRDFSTEDAGGRSDRRKARWIPTTLLGWPARGG
jgi:hypothetical protein